MNKEQFEQLPRAKRWSFSRLMSFADCPRKHHYSYIEEMPRGENIYTLIGGYWHDMIDCHNKGELDKVEEILKEFEDRCKMGVINQDPMVLRHVYTEYLNYYDPVNVLYSEQEIIEEWEDGDHFIYKVDCIYEKDGLNILRDYKTTIKKLKYDHGKVKYNQQLLMYKQAVEDHLPITIHGIEIDEIKIAMCIPVPINKNGKPTADVRKLGLVKYETYMNKLIEMGLDANEEYQNAINELEKRGHPLFRRIVVDVLDDHVPSENFEDMYNWYKLAKTSATSRKRSILCDYCNYRMLCDAEYSFLDEQGKQILIEKIAKI